MDVNECEKLSDITHRHKLYWRNGAFIAVLHFTVTVIVTFVSIYNLIWHIHVSWPDIVIPVVDS
jgi:hypothetical protein